MGEGSGSSSAGGTSRPTRLYVGELPIKFHDSEFNGQLLLTEIDHRRLSLKTIALALIQAKSKFAPISKGKFNPHFKSKYAALDDILAAIEPGLSASGLVVIQPTEIRDGSVVLKTILIHGESGEQLFTELVIPPQTDPQKFGAALTYYRRFSLCTLLAIAADEDGDGNNTLNPQPKSSNSKRSNEIAALKATHNLSDADVKEIIRGNFGDKKVGEMDEQEYSQLIKLIRALVSIRRVKN